ncbi:MAG: hypothetical protein HOK06_08490, partial [Rhodospirillaceae bacterium]|nr:hypothetical protein [Rhodospirillaceae bacterium]
GIDLRIAHFIRVVYRHHGPDGVMARTTTVGSMVQWVIVLLGVYLALYLVWG